MAPKPFFASLLTLLELGSGLIKISLLFIMLEARDICTLLFAVSQIRLDCYEEPDQYEYNEYDQKRRPVWEVLCSSEMVCVDRSGCNSDNVDQPPKSKATQCDQFQRAPHKEAEVKVVSPQEA
jgi:hypothetical protein